jgi:hypothetical protein
MQVHEGLIMLYIYIYYEIVRRGTKQQKVHEYKHQ